MDPETEFKFDISYINLELVPNGKPLRSGISPQGILNVGRYKNVSDRSPNLSVKQYVPKMNPSPGAQDISIVGAHANGFVKVSSNL